MNGYLLEPFAKKALVGLKLYVDQTGLELRGLPASRGPRLPSGAEIKGSTILG